MTATDGPSQPGSDPRADQIYAVVLRRGAALRRRRRIIGTAAGGAVATAGVVIGLLLVPSGTNSRSVNVVAPDTTTTAAPSPPPVGPSRPPATRPTTPPATRPTTPPASVSPTSTAPPPPSLAAVSTVPLQLGHRGEFYSPSHNISCEIDDPGGAYCESISTMRSIQISSSGSVVDNCSGQRCGSNAGLDTPTLLYGSSTGAGPFRCVSLTSGMICTGSGRGFMISRAGVVTCTGSTASGTLTVCPGSGPVGTTVTITGHGCAATSVTVGGTGVAVAPGAGDDFAGTWTIPTSPASDDTFRTDGHGCSAPFRVTAG